VQRANAFVNQIKKIGLQVMSPRNQLIHQCAICSQSTDWPEQVCPWCILSIDWNSSPCPSCAQPTCSFTKCCVPEEPAPWLRCYSATIYEYPMIQLFNQLKVGLRKGRAATIAYLLEQYLEANRHSPLPEQIIPIPSTPSALKRRGFNPVSLIADKLSDRYRSLLAPEILISQDLVEAKQLNRQERQQRQPFKIMYRPKKHIAILDDVMTTGHTLKAAAKLLKHHGAVSIEVWTAARTPPKTYYDIAMAVE